MSFPCTPSHPTSMVVVVVVAIQVGSVAVAVPPGTVKLDCAVVGEVVVVPVPSGEWLSQMRSHRVV